MTPIPDDVRVAVIVVAAGSGTRLGHEEPKAFVELRGATILEHALRGVFGAVEPAQVIVVAPRALVSRAARDRASTPRVAASDYVVGRRRRRHAAGARSRPGLAALATAVEVVLVHDAARALTPSALFDRVVQRGAAAAAAA